MNLYLQRNTIYNGNISGFVEIEDGVTIPVQVEFDYSPHERQTRQDPECEANVEITWVTKDCGEDLYYKIQNIEEVEEELLEILCSPDERY